MDGIIITGLTGKAYDEELERRTKLIENAYENIVPDKSITLQEWFNSVKGTDKKFYDPEKKLYFQITDTGDFKYLPKTDAGIINDLINNSYNTNSLYGGSKTYEKSIKATYSNNTQTEPEVKKYNINGIIVSATDTVYGKYENKYVYNGKVLYLSNSDYIKLKYTSYNKNVLSETDVKINNITDGILKTLLLNTTSTYFGYDEDIEVESYDEIVPLRQAAIDERKSLIEILELISEKLLPSSVHDLLVSIVMVKRIDELRSLLNELNNRIYNYLYFFDLENLKQNVQYMKSELSYRRNALIYEESFDKEKFIDGLETLNGLYEYVLSKKIDYLNDYYVEYGNTDDKDNQTYKEYVKENGSKLISKIITWHELKYESNALLDSIEYNIDYLNKVLYDLDFITIILSDSIHRILDDIKAVVTDIKNRTLTSAMVDDNFFELTERDNIIVETTGKLEEVIINYKNELGDELKKSEVELNPLHIKLNKEIFNFIEWINNMADDAADDVIYCEDALAKFSMLKEAERSNNTTGSYLSTSYIKLLEPAEEMLYRALSSSTTLYVDGISLIDYFNGWVQNYNIHSSMYQARMYFITRLFGIRKYYMHTLVKLLRSGKEGTSGFIRDSKIPMSENKPYETRFETKHLTADGGRWLFEYDSQLKYFQSKNIDINSNYEMIGILSEYTSVFKSAKNIQHIKLEPYYTEYRFVDDLYKQTKFIIFQELITSQYGLEQMVNLFYNIYQVVSGNKLDYMFLGHEENTYSYTNPITNTNAKMKSIKDLIFEYSFISLLEDISPLNYLSDDTIRAISELIKDKDEILANINRAIEFIKTEYTYKYKYITIDMMLKDGSWYKNMMNLIVYKYIQNDTIKSLLTKYEEIDFKFIIPSTPSTDEEPDSIIWSGGRPAAVKGVLSLERMD